MDVLEGKWVDFEGPSGMWKVVCRFVVKRFTDLGSVRAFIGIIASQKRSPEKEGRESVREPNIQRYLLFITDLSNRQAQVPTPAFSGFPPCHGPVPPTSHLMLQANPNPFEFSNAIASLSFKTSLLEYSGRRRMP